MKPSVFEGLLQNDESISAKTDEKLFNLQPQGRGWRLLYGVTTG